MKFTKRLFLTAAGLLILFPTNTFAASSGLDSFPDPVDSEPWVLPEDMTWDDYNPVPGIDWNTANFQPETELKGALIFVDFPDLDFIITEPEGSDPAGNPQGIGEISREDVPEFWRSFLNDPSEQNNYQTLDGFWKENSYGDWGVSLDTYGPYRLDKNEFQYGLDRFNPDSLPPGYSSGNLFDDGIAIATDDIISSGEDYDFAFIVHAGYAESAIWQEFGEMMFADRDSIPDEFGPPNMPGFEDMPNWVPSRYVPWTSYFAGKAIWSAASSATIGGEQIRVSHQGEHGMSTFGHEFGHLRGLGDNYNNAAEDNRTYSGHFETMSRGSFNGPGGTHTRWHIPARQGGSIPSPHTLRNKMKQGFLTDDEVLHLDRDEFAETGLVVTDVVGRQVPIGDEFNRTGLHGINISMEDLTPSDYLEGDWRNDMVNGGYDNYTIEVIDQVGADSFQTDSGVLIAKTKNAESAPFIWVVDSHPEDINQVDFVRPDGTESMISKGDPRQLSDALFHAGDGVSLKSGVFDGSIDEDSVVSEYVDEYNRLHFYILDKHYDEEGALSYRVAIRHLDDVGNFEHGVETTVLSTERATPGKVGTHTFSVTNTGEETDLFRIEVDTASGWETMIQHNVIEVEAGETVEVPVYTEIPEEKQDPTNLTFTVTSETDPNQTESETNILLNDISSTGLKALVEGFEENGEFIDDAARALTMHLTAVEHFEKQEQGEKIIKHMEGFKILLDNQIENDLISEKALNALKDYTNFFIDQW